MKSILKSGVLLSGGWTVSLVFGLVTAKATAVLIGPAGVGLLGLLHSTLGLAALAAMMVGTTTGLIRAVARARASRDARAEAALRHAAWWLWAGLGGGAAVVMLLLREPLARFLLGTAVHSTALVPLAVALLLSLATGVQTGVLTAHGRISELARINMANSVIGPALLLPLVWFWREDGLPWVVLGGSLASFVTSRFHFRSTAASPRVTVTAAEIRRSARMLVGLGLPLNLSALASSGIQLAMPVLVMSYLGGPAVGLYRAAAGVSQMYLGFLPPVMGQEYYPRAAAASDDPDALSSIINDQTRLALLVAGPIVLVTLTLVPVLVPLIYARSFAPAVDLLEWQMIGDVLKVVSTALGFGILARSGGAVLLYGDLVGAASVVGLSSIGLGLWGLEGLGLAFLASSAIVYLVYWAILRRTIGFRFSGTNRALTASFVAAALLIRALPLAGLDALRIPVGLGLGACGAWCAWRILARDIGRAAGVGVSVEVG